MDRRRFWVGMLLALALVLGQASGYAHLLRHLGELGKGAPHSETCPFDALYCQLAGGVAHTAPPVTIRVEPSAAALAPEAAVRSVVTILPCARAPPPQS